MKKKKILIVEDERIVAEDIKMKLELSGYSVAGIVSSGKEAIKKSEKLGPDLVLMDIVLEGKMNGIKAAGVILSRFNIPVVYLTAYSDKKTLARAKVTEPFGFIIKPFEAQEIFTAIEMALYRHTLRNMLKESEERYSALFERSLSYVYVHDFKGQFIDANPAALKALGYTRKEMVALNFAFLLDRSQLPKAFKSLQEIIRTGHQKKPDEYKLKKKDGRFIWVETEGSLIYKDGKPFAIQGIARDITAKKIADKALIESEEKFRTLAEKSPNMIFINKQGRVIYANKRCEEIMGYKKEEFYSPDFEFFRLIAPEHLEKIKLSYNQHKKGKDVRPYEYALITKDGERIEAILTSRLINYEGEKAILGIITDITELKQAEEVIRESREQLRNLAAHLQSVREEERAVIAREIHDELGQALTAVKMDLSWLDKKIPKKYGTLFTKTKEMSELIDSTIQTVQRISAELRPGLLDDIGLLAAVEWQAEDFQKRTGISCDLSVSSQDITLDENRSTALFRIFQEALTNITRHAHASHVKVNLAKKDNTIELKVKDNGRGIIKEKISDPKSLGLMGIQERVYSLDGKINIRGIPNKGTTVTVSIPLSRRGENR
ncbi:MAG: PAS domain S-box protein [Candidatus Aminicenantes bacterium]|jgi:PAS domain S-box-containing protein